MLCAFDLIELDGDDLRRSSIEYRKPDVGYRVLDRRDVDRFDCVKSTLRFRRTSEVGKSTEPYLLRADQTTVQTRIDSYGRKR